MQEILITAAIIFVIIIAIIAFLCSIYRVADIDKALIVTGGKEPVIKVSGGSFVIPIFRKASYFDLCMLTVSADKDEIKTSTAVPIIVDWTAQIRPHTSDMEALKKCIVSFKERGSKGIINDVKLTLTGAVRDIVASMTPEGVLKDKAAFADNVRKTVADEMLNMGMELVSLNIQDITDNKHYYDNIAALDAESKRQAAETKKAEVEREVRKNKADSEKQAKEAELNSELAIAEREKNNSLKKSEYKIETDTAKANAAIAEQLQATKRQQEVAVEEGKVAIVRQEQANLAAQREKEVIVTRANAEKDKKRIEAEADANVRTIEADAKVAVAQKDAESVKIKAAANAEQITKEGTANAEVIKQRGIADAEAKKAQLLAEAEGEKAKLLAQAEGERALAEARASNDKVNFEIEKLQIEADARIEIATKTATIMANLGQNAEFVNIGGSGPVGEGHTGNVLLDTLSALPLLLKKLDVENKALDSDKRPFNETLSELVGSIAKPIKGDTPAALDTSNSIDCDEILDDLPDDFTEDDELIL